jgi:hypothetical protein
MRAFGYTPACRRLRFRHEAILSHMKEYDLSIGGTILGRRTMSTVLGAHCILVRGLRSGSDRACFLFLKGRGYEFKRSSSRK